MSMRKARVETPTGVAVGQVWAPYKGNRDTHAKVVAIDTDTSTVTLEVLFKPRIPQMLLQMSFDNLLRAYWLVATPVGTPDIGFTLH